MPVLDLRNRRSTGKGTIVKKQQEYQAPRLFLMGRLNEVTLGGAGSRCDGFSGNQGKNGPAMGCGNKPGKGAGSL